MTETLPAELTSERFGGGCHGGFSLSLENTLGKESKTDGGEAGDATLHVVAVVVRAIVLALLLRRVEGDGA